MKRGQSKLTIILLIFIFIILVIVVFNLSKQSQEIEDQEKQEILPVLATNHCSVNSPFSSCYIHPRSDEIILGFKNSGDDDLIITQIEITGCGITNPNLIYVAESPVQVSISCSLEEGKEYSEDIIITYRIRGEGTLYNSVGTLKAALE